MIISAQNSGTNQRGFDLVPLMVSSTRRVFSACRDIMRCICGVISDLSAVALSTACTLSMETP